MLLDRIDELPLRRHEIRGNPAGLLARIVDRIDALKSAGVTAERFRRWSEEQAGDEPVGARLRRQGARVRRDLRAARLDAARGRRDGRQRRRARADQAARRAARRWPRPISERFPHLIVDEAEDACPAERALIEALARGARRPRCSPATTSRPARRCGAAVGLGAPGARRRGGDARAELALRRGPARRRARGGRPVRARRRGPPRRAAGPADPGPLLVRDQRARRGTGRRPRHRDVRSPPAR